MTVPTSVCPRTTTSVSTTSTSPKPQYKEPKPTAFQMIYSTKNSPPASTPNPTPTPRLKRAHPSDDEDITTPTNQALNVLMRNEERWTKRPTKRLKASPVHDIITDRSRLYSDIHRDLEFYKNLRTSLDNSYNAVGRKMRGVSRVEFEEEQKRLDKAISRAVVADGLAMIAKERRDREVRAREVADARAKMGQVAKEVARCAREAEARRREEICDAEELRVQHAREVEAVRRQEELRGEEEARLAQEKALREEERLEEVNRRVEEARCDAKRQEQEARFLTEQQEKESLRLEQERNARQQADEQAAAKHLLNGIPWSEIPAMPSVTELIARLVEAWPGALERMSRASSENLQDATYVTALWNFYIVPAANSFFVLKTNASSQDIVSTGWQLPPLEELGWLLTNMPEDRVVGGIRIGDLKVQVKTVGRILWAAIQEVEALSRAEELRASLSSSTESAPDSVFCAEESDSSSISEEFSPEPQTPTDVPTVTIPQTPIEISANAPVKTPIKPKTSGNNKFLNSLQSPITSDDEDDSRDNNGQADESEYSDTDIDGIPDDEPTPTTSHMPPTSLCKFFQRGTCKNNENCIFYHDSAHPTNWTPRAPTRNNIAVRSQLKTYSPTPCIHFQRGSCRNGDRCAYSHNVPQTHQPAGSRIPMAARTTTSNGKNIFLGRHKLEYPPEAPSKPYSSAPSSSRATPIRQYLPGNMAGRPNSFQDADLESQIRLLQRNASKQNVPHHNIFSSDIRYTPSQHYGVKTAHQPRPKHTHPRSPQPRTTGTRKRRPSVLPRVTPCPSSTFQTPTRF